MAEEKKSKLFAPSRLVFYVLAIIVIYLAIHYFSKFAAIEKLLLQMRRWSGSRN